MNAALNNPSNSLPKAVSGSLISRMPVDEYFALPEVSITRLKELRRSPQHYRYRLQSPKESAPLSLGRAAHCAVLEAPRFTTDFVVWNRRTESGKSAPRNGKWWDAFEAEAVGRSIITQDEYELAVAMQDAVHSNREAARYLASGEPEVVMQWEINGRPCRGRVDWLTCVDGRPCVVGLKTARDCRHFAFGAAAARLGYHLQWAFYLDGYKIITEVEPRMLEIVVESEPPHAVAVYAISDDILEQGRAEYDELLTILDRCEATNDWPGPVPVEEFLTLPTWAYPHNDDIADLGLES